MLTKFEVTETDIKTGIKNNCDYCPIANSIKGTIPAIDVRVTASDVIIFQYNRKANETIKLPQNAIDFIKSFNKGEPVKPFTFELDLPEGLTNA